MKLSHVFPTRAQLLLRWPLMLHKWNLCCRVGYLFLTHSFSEYCNKSYIAENYIVDSVYYIFVAATSTQLTPKAISSVE